VVEELLKVKNLIFVLGNHDIWWTNHLFKGQTPIAWVTQGGANTLNSYGGKVIPDVMLNIDGVKVPKTHIEFFGNGLYYYEFDEMVFVHGGFNPETPIKEQELESLLWDRSIIKYAESNNIKNYKKVFIGHTTTQHIERNWVNYQCRNCAEEWEKQVTVYKDMMGEPVCPKCKSMDIFQSLGCTKPLKIGNLYCLDTGGGWDGRLTIMDIDSEEFWQSKLQTPAILK
jgi:serine/threonine protein phosphatase 1